MAEQEQRRDEMDEILRSVAFSEEVKSNFKREKITPSVVLDLCKEELCSLGVSLLGDQKRLRAACNPPHTSFAVADEVRRVMGPRSPHPGQSRQTPMNFNPNALVNRTRPRGRGPKKGKKKIGKSVMRNISVIKYSKCSPQEFSQKSTIFIASGIVELTASGNEDEIRDAIANVINGCSKCESVGPNDFEFVKRYGHNFRIPAVAPGFHFDMDALKTLVGQGALYVRLTRDVDSSLSDSSMDLSEDEGPPSRTPQSVPSTPNTQIKSTSQRSSQCLPHPSSQSLPGPSSVSPSSQSLPGPSTPASHTLVDLTCSSDSSSSLSSSPVTKKVKFAFEKDDSQNVIKLNELFPNVEPSVCATVLEYVAGNMSLAIDTILGNGEISTILACLGERKLTGLTSFLVVDASEAISSAVAYYKRPSLDMKRPVSIKFSGTPSIDAGGPKRQFYTDTLRALREGYNLFEGTANCLVPVYSTSVLASGLFKVLGQVIVHSILQEGPGFPFFAPFVYKCICGESIEETIQEVQLTDVSKPVAHIVDEILNAKNIDDISKVSEREEFLRLQTESGLRVLPSVSNKLLVAQEFLTHEAITRRQPIISQLCQGLESLGFLESVKQMPSLFQPIFVSAKQEITPEKVMSLLHFPVDMQQEDEIMCADFLKQYVFNASTTVLKKFLRFATGSEELPAIGYGTGQLTVNISSQLNGVCASTCTLTIHVPVFKEYEQLSTALNCVIAEDVFNTV